MESVGAPPPSKVESRWWCWDSDERLSSVPNEYDVTEMFSGTSYSPVQYLYQNYHVIVRFVTQEMAESGDVDQLFVLLRICIRNLSSGLLLRDRQVDTRISGTYRAFIASSNLASAYIQIVTRFLADNFTPAKGGLAINLGGIRQKLLAHGK